MRILVILFGLIQLCLATVEVGKIAVLGDGSKAALPSDGSGEFKPQAIDEKKDIFVPEAKLKIKEDLKEGSKLVLTTRYKILSCDDPEHPLKLIMSEVK